MTSSDIEGAVIEAIRTVRDPEIPVNLHDLGLIYDVSIDAEGVVAIRMTLTTPNCPVAESMPEQVRAAVAAVPGVTEARVELVWDPPWSSERMSEDAKLQLEMMGISWSDPHSGPKGTSLTVGRTGRRGRDRRS